MLRKVSSPDSQSPKTGAPTSPSPASTSSPSHPTTNLTPDLADFLASGPPPVYIGFGSIVVEDPNAMTKLIFDAVKKTGQRALVSKG